MQRRSNCKGSDPKDGVGDDINATGVNEEEDGDGDGVRASRLKGRWTKCRTLSASFSICTLTQIKLSAAEVSAAVCRESTCQ